MNTSSSDYTKLAAEVVRQARLDKGSSKPAVRKSAERFFNSPEKEFPFSFQFIKDYFETSVAPSLALATFTPGKRVPTCQ